MKSSAVIFDFAGMPGSGKSTLSHLAAQIIRGRGIKITEPTYHINNEMNTLQRCLVKMRYTINLAVLRPGWAFAWLLVIIRSRQKTLQNFFGMIINCFYILEIFRRSMSRPGVYLFDQGIFQALWSLSYTSNDIFIVDKNIIRGLQLIIPEKLHLVYIKADYKSIIRRLKERKGNQSRLDFFKYSDTIFALINKAQMKMDQMLAAIQNKLNTIDIITLQNTDFDQSLQSAHEISALVEKAVTYQDVEKVEPFQHPAKVLPGN